MSHANYEEVVSQLKSELNTDCAISNRYGIILASLIKEFAKGKIIPQKILELISEKEQIAEELNLKQINSFALESMDYNYLFSFSEELILISRVPLNVNLAKFMPSIRTLTLKLSKSYQEQEGGIKEFSVFDFSKDITKIESALKEEDINKEKYAIIKDLINFISK
jgi:hypothetical protein